MKSELWMLIAGLVCILIGLANRKGKPSIIHGCCFADVSDADRPKYGAAMGNAMLALGGGLTLTWVQRLVFGADTIPFLIGLGIGAWMFISLSAQLLYNKRFLLG